MLSGFQFDLMQVFPTSDASLYSYLNDEKSGIIPNRGDEFEITTNGLNITVGTGQAIIKGRLVQIDEPITINVSANYNGYLVIEIDLSKSNTASGEVGTSSYNAINNQLSIKTVTSLTNDDINDGGLLYHFNLGVITSTTSTITFTNNNNVRQHNGDLLFSGGVNSGNLTLNDNIYNYKFIVVFIAGSTTGTPFGTGIMPVLDTPPTNMNVICGDTTSNNNHSTYMGKLKINSSNQLSIAQQFTNVTHNTGKSHGGGTTYYVRQIWGVR